MIRKARDNLETADALLAWHNAADAAANRYYYAAYQAAWFFLVKCGLQAPSHDGREYFRHAEMQSKLEEKDFGDRLGIGSEWQDSWQNLFDLRLKADYYQESVRECEIEKLQSFVDAVVKAAASFKR
jgi:uncharacterized protein (UPF0332 family)